MLKNFFLENMNVKINEFLIEYVDMEIIEAQVLLE